MNSDTTDAFKALRDLCDVFSIFHDGSIADFDKNGDFLTLEIECRYLAAIIDDYFDGLKVYDQNKVEMAIDRLDEICRLCWDALQNRNKANNGGPCQKAYNHFARAIVYPLTFAPNKHQ